MSTPLRACRPRLTAAQGPRVEQRAILARTLQRSRSSANASEHSRRCEQTYHQPSKMQVLDESALDPYAQVATMRSWLDAVSAAPYGGEHSAQSGPAKLRIVIAPAGIA